MLLTAVTTAQHMLFFAALLFLLPAFATAGHTVCSWKPGDRVIVSGTVSTEDAKAKFQNVEELKPYLRYADAP